MNKEFLKLIEETFKKNLEFKNGWGKNEVFMLYRESVVEAKEKWFEMQEEKING